MFIKIDQIFKLYSFCRLYPNYRYCVSLIFVKLSGSCSVLPYTMNTIRISSHRQRFPPCSRLALQSSKYCVWVFLLGNLFLTCSCFPRYFTASNFGLWFFRLGHISGSFYFILDSKNYYISRLRPEDGYLDISRLLWSYTLLNLGTGPHNFTHWATTPHGCHIVLTLVAPSALFHLDTAAFLPSLVHCILLTTSRPRPGGTTNP
jgi:hypothetical protein